MAEKNQQEEAPIFWKETFDGTKLTDQYANIVANIEQEFKTPEEQLRALAAFNSRALAHSAAKTPVMFRGRETNAYYISALEAMEPKGNNKK